MYLLRRAAARAIVQQPARQFSTLRSSCRVTSLQSWSRPALHRPFHQSRIWLAEKEDRTSPAETEEAGITTEAAAEEELYDEESIATEEVADGAQHTSAYQDAPPQESAPAREQPTLTERAASVASSAARTVRTATSDAVSAARSTANAASRSSDRGESNTGKILYVGNLFFEVTRAHLETEFARYGAIANTRIVADARGLSKGFGYVEFERQSDADRALRELDQTVLQGRRMAVQYHVPRERSNRNARGPMDAENRAPNPPSKTLFVGNMSYQMSDRDLNDLFRDVKNVLDVRVAIDRRTGQPRGFAHADFADEASATRAKGDLEQKVVYGRQLRIDYSQTTRASGDRGPSV